MTSILLAMGTINFICTETCNFSKMTCFLKPMTEKKIFSANKDLNYFCLFMKGMVRVIYFSKPIIVFSTFYFYNILFLFYQNEKCGLLNNDPKTLPQINRRLVKVYKKFIHLQYTCYSINAPWTYVPLVVSKGVDKKS